LWEFPGGKVEPGESDDSALKRELRERVGVEVEVKLRMAQRSHQYDGYSVDLTLYQASILPDQEPRPLRVADFRWAASEEFEKYPFPAADQATTDLLLGFQALVTPTSRFHWGAELRRGHGVGVRRECEAAIGSGDATDVAVPAIAIIVASRSTVAPF